MKGQFFKHNNSNTEFIEFNSKYCNACWKCVEICSFNVLRKIDFLGHRHVKIIAPDKCKGCLKCVNACEFNALRNIIPIVIKNKLNIKDEREHFNKRAFISIAMFISGLILPISGIMNHNLQFEPLTHQRHFWMSVHNISASLFAILAIIHIALNWSSLKKHIIKVKKVSISKEAITAIILIIIIVVLFSSHVYLVS